jgi:hypothetical protein
VWVSFDDGASWQSLRLNMPAISVRDIQVKDDSTCLCADLIAGTHGRGFWILDDLSPLRQMAKSRGATGTYLVKPNTAVRVRLGTNEPTPWPPELPAAENPPNGAIIDYALGGGADAVGTVKLEIVNASGRVIRSYSSDDPVLDPDPAVDPVAYNRLCQKSPSAPDCGLPLYWPAPQQRLSTRAGLHRFMWDMRYQPIGDNARTDDVEATGAVPHRSEHTPRAPWAAPGRYTVRLTVNGRSYTQPLTLRLDPRVKTPAAGLTQLAALSREMYDLAAAAQTAYQQAARSDSLSRALASARDRALAATMAMQDADVAPTAAQVAACARARTLVTAVLARWRARLGQSQPR